jgi:hypothetical protein
MALDTNPTLHPPPGLRRLRSDIGAGPGAPQTEDQFIREWGITPDAELKLLAEFRDRVKAAGLCIPSTDDHKLRRFLRARQHDLDRAMAMWRAHAAFRREFGCDTLLTDFHFHERDAFISIYPQGYHKTDKMVSAGGCGERERDGRSGDCEVEAQK